MPLSPQMLRGGWHARLRIVLRCLRLKKKPLYFAQDFKEDGQVIKNVAKLYFTTKMGSQTIHHSFMHTALCETTSMQGVSQKAVRHLCKRYKISLSRLNRWYERQRDITLTAMERDEAERESQPQEPEPLPSPTPPSPVARQRVTGNRQEYLQRFTPAVVEEDSPPVRNSWVFNSDSEEEDPSERLFESEWEP